MKKTFSKYKVNCSEISDLMSKEQGNNLPTHEDLNEFFRIIQKDMVDITERQKQLLLDVVYKTSTYDNNSISATTKKALYNHYTYSLYRVGKVSLSGEKPLQFDKGEVAEPDAIKLLSKLDNKEYTKNETLYSNNFFKGIPDILITENDKIVGVKDIKIPIDFPSFLERVDGDLLKDDAWEMRGYLDILDLKQGEICYCLVNMPDKFKEKRLSEHNERMILQGYTTEHIKKRLKQIEKSMQYDYIPDELRVRRFLVERKGYFTNQMHKRVKLLRSRLAQLHNKFTNPLILLESKEQSQTDIS